MKTLWEEKYIAVMGSSVVDLSATKDRIALSKVIFQLLNRARISLTWAFLSLKKRISSEGSG